MSLKRQRIDSYRQKENAWKILGHGFAGVSKGQRAKEMKMLCLLYRDAFGLKAKELREELERFCAKWIKEYHFRSYYREILQAVQYASDKTRVLIQVNGLPVYKEEIDYIVGLPLPEKDKRVMFTILMTKKMDGECYEQRFHEPYKTGFLSADDKKLRRLKRASGLSAQDDLAGDILHRWLTDGYIRSTYTGFILDFLNDMPHGGEKVMEVRHYDCYGSYYACLLDGERRAMCEKCGRPIVKGKTRKKLCKDCALEFFHVREPAVKEYVCDRCGCKFYAEARAVKTSTCPQCKMKGESFLFHAN